MRDGNSPAQQTGDEENYLERRSGRRVRTEKASAALPGDALVELKGGLGCRCRRVEERGLVNVLLPGGRTARG